MADTSRRKPDQTGPSKTDTAADTKTDAADPSNDSEPLKPLAVGDVVDGWTVDAIEGDQVLLALGAERRSRPLAELEHERQAGPISKVAVGDVIDGWTVLAINSPTDVRCTQGPEQRTLTLQDLERAKLAAQTLTTADLERAKRATPAPAAATAGAPSPKPKP
jgi:hypothetical protein